MRKRIITLTVVSIAAIGLIIAYVVSNNTNPQPTSSSNVQTQTTSETDTGTSQPTARSTNQKGNYVDYSEGVIASTSGTKLLFFHAPWCPQCRSLESSIKQSGVPDGVTVIKVDYDSNQQLRQKYGVRIQTTVVRINDQGELVESFVAYDDPSIKAVAEALL